MDAGQAQRWLGSSARPARTVAPGAPRRALLVFEDVHKSYRTDSPVLRGVNLTVDSGEFVFVTGPSGAGKSTLLRLLYAAEQADSGRVLFMDREVGRLKPDSVAYLRRNLGVVFQDFKLVEGWSVLENVGLPLEVLGMPERHIRQRVGDVLERVGLGKRGSDLAGSLSGGEQQRVAIARAMVGEPALLLADEPTGNLDPQLAVDILGLFHEINQTGVTVVFATHDRSLLESTPRRVIVLDEGRAIDVVQGLIAAEAAGLRVA
jgi:cell division transport system ATP-binding protein